MNKAVAYGWVSEMEKIEDFFCRWGSDLEKTAAASSREEKIEAAVEVPSVYVNAYKAIKDEK